jgi:hypothetical protein
MIRDPIAIRLNAAGDSPGLHRSHRTRTATDPLLSIREWKSAFIALSAAPLLAGRTARVLVAQQLYTLPEGCAYAHMGS